MSISISGTPTIVPGPAFAGITIRIPLSAAPSAEWLDHLASEAPPGKGHRINGNSIEFCLDRESSDVDATLTRIAKAIESVSARVSDAAPVDGKQREADARRALEEKASRLMAKWWERNRPAPKEDEAAVVGGPALLDSDAKDKTAGGKSDDAAPSRAEIQSGSGEASPSSETEKSDEVRREK
jgi:hypothetical protein